MVSRAPAVGPAAAHSRSRHAAVIDSFTPVVMGGAGWRDLLIEEDRYGFKLAMGSGSGIARFFHHPFHQG
ncbi:hypothetical protein KAM385_40170 [Aeromonas hydrophila]|nr:hypothetical protein KAM385_40170 [Aeromonas hydrophila]